MRHGYMRSGSETAGAFIWGRFSRGFIVRARTTGIYWGARDSTSGRVAMSPLAIVLILAATLSHASWNFLTKRSRDRLAFLWWTGVAGSVLFLPVVVWVAPPWTLAAERLGGRDRRRRHSRGLLRGAGGSVYARGDLSLVYPLARGTAPLLVPPLAVLFLGERPSPVGWAGIAIIGLGIYVLHLPGFDAARRARPAPRPPVGACRLRSSSPDASPRPTPWSTPGTSGVACRRSSTPTSRSRWRPSCSPRSWARRPESLIAERRTGGRAIVMVGILMTGGYLLVLRALRLAPVSYVAPARELSIVIGTVLGLVLLREPAPAPRLCRRRIDRRRRPAADPRRPLSPRAIGLGRPTGAVRSTHGSARAAPCAPGLTTVPRRP